MADRHPAERVLLQFHEQFLRCGSDAPLFGLFIREWGITISQASVIPSYAVLALGLSVSHRYHHENSKETR
jgi:hypothetical protein